MEQRSLRISPTEASSKFLFHPYKQVCDGYFYCTVPFTLTELLKPLERGPCQRSRQQHGQTRGVLSFWSTGVGCSGRNQGAGFARLYSRKCYYTMPQDHPMVPTRMGARHRHTLPHGADLRVNKKVLRGSVCLHTYLCTAHRPDFFVSVCVCPSYPRRGNDGVAQRFHAVSKTVTILKDKCVELLV